MRSKCLFIFNKITALIQWMLPMMFMFVGFFSTDIILRYYTSDIGFYDIRHLAPMFFTVCWCCFLILFVYSLPRKVGRIVYFIIAIVLTLYGCAQYIYYQLFQNFIWFNDLAMAGEGSDYLSFVLGLIDNRLLSILLTGLICMVFALIFFPKKKNTLFSLSIHSIIFGCVLIFYSTIPDMIGIQQQEARWDSWRDPRNVYDQFSNQAWMMQVSGYYEYINRDFYMTYLKTNTIDQADYDSIDEYLQSKPEIEENDMTGVYKDKNVILVLLESMDDWLISEKYTPTIEYMMANGLNFTDHYAPIFSSGATFNSEFAANTGTYSPNGGNAAYSFSKNTFSESLPNLFKNQGYSVKSFHYNVPEFYNRAIMHKNFGYEEYVSFTDLLGGDYTAASIDTIMTQNEEIYSKMIEGEKFFDFVITYSAHLPYSTYADMCAYQVENEPELWDYNMNDETNCAHMQAKITDNFFKELLIRLEEDGLLEDTVIIGYTDHYTYGYSDADALQVFTEAAGSSIVDKVPFFVYNYGREDLAQEVTKANSMIDILPTVANLLGLDYGNYYVGYDIFDDRYRGYAYFKDYSWYDGHTYYKDGEVVFTDESGLTNIDEMNRIVSDNIKYGEMIVTDNYFAYLKKHVIH